MCWDRFNRNILGCKVLTAHLIDIALCDLIETYWDVKVINLN